jgi:hypothetical protein
LIPEIGGAACRIALTPKGGSGTFRMKWQHRSGELSMNLEEISRNLIVGTNSTAVSEAAKRQIAAEVLESKAHLSETRLGASFLDSFNDFLAGPM